MATSIRPTITWVNDTPSASGKTVKVYLMHPSFTEGVTHFANVPVGMNPRKWDVIEADTVKLAEVETDYLNEETGMRVELKTPRRQVSFFGAIALCDSETPETVWTDKRSVKNASTVITDEEPF